MDVWQIIMMLAMVVQLVTEAVARLYPRGTVYVAAAVGVVVAVVTQTGVLDALGARVTAPLVDQVLTGLLLAGGASALNTLLQYLRGPKAPAA
ncbi:MAG: hypothetical protein RB148_11735 [Armatimonadota bacterium]|nr:hypothetical protein [Armatimonadota bacterium]